MVNYRDLLTSVKFKSFLKAIIKNNLPYRYGYVECCVFTDVSEENKEIGTSNPHRSRRTFTKMTCFICNLKRISDNNTFNVGVIRRNEMNCSIRRLIDWSKY